MRGSLLLLGGEGFLSLRGVHDEVIGPIMFDNARGDELLHHLCSQLASLNVLRQLHDLLLQSLYLGIFGGFFDLFLHSCLLLSLDLGLGPATLR